MSGRWLINLALAAALLVLTSLIMAELQRPEQLPRLAEPGALPPRLIAIERPGEPVIRLQANAEGEWSLIEPLRVDAERARVESLLSILISPVTRSMPVESLDMAALGLAPPRLWLRIDTLELAIGASSPIGQQRYVASGAMVHLIDERFTHLLMVPAREFVSRALLPRGFAPVAASLDGVALSAETLEILTSLRAERIEALAREALVSLIEVSSVDGRTLRFEVSADRRLWARPELGLAYRLVRAPELETDADGEMAPVPLSEPEPHSPQPASMMSIGDPFAPVAPLPDAAPLDPFANPEAPLPGDLPLGEPPPVRLSPDEQIEQDSDGFGAERYKEPPPGFGVDPFAPDD